MQGLTPSEIDEIEAVVANHLLVALSVPGALKQKRVLETLATDIACMLNARENSRYRGRGDWSCVVGEMFAAAASTTKLVAWDICGKPAIRISIVAFYT